MNTAVFLGQPLLLMGEPGTGKTQLAHSVAWEFDLPLHVFNTKMNSAGLDLFYHYDSLLHFHDAHTLGQIHNPKKYIQYAALGKAILFTHPPGVAGEYMPESMLDHHREATRSVVLIDEIDKAPRDFPNDILAETEQNAFEVRETGWRLAAERSLRPIVIITSNQERNLPEAFLRRCVFYYIRFPEEVQLREIVRRRLQGRFDEAIRKFLEIRADAQLIKKPATAELLSWLRILQHKDINDAEIARGGDRLRGTYSALLKHPDDFERVSQPQSPRKPKA